jgi:hypothetical protein
MLHDVTVTCPYCGEPFDAEVDCSAGDQAYVEDCWVCCRPIEIRITCGPGGELLAMEALRDDE